MSGTSKDVCENCGKELLHEIKPKGHNYFGQLYEAEADKNGTVWYKVKYKEKYRWVMSDFAEARVETDATKERLPQATGTELTGYFFMSAAPVAEALSVDDEGFCGYLVVVVADDDTIQAICLYSDTVEQRFTSY